MVPLGRSWVGRRNEGCRMVEESETETVLRLEYHGRESEVSRRCRIGEENAETKEVELRIDYQGRGRDVLHRWRKVVRAPGE